MKEYIIRHVGWVHNDSTYENDGNHHIVTRFKNKVEVETYRSYLNRIYFVNWMDVIHRFETWNDFHKEYQTHGVESYRGYYNDSIKMMNSPELSAFDLTQESKEDRKMYNIPSGESFLLARRLLEANVQYVSLSFGGWNRQENNGRRK